MEQKIKHGNTFRLAGLIQQRSEPFQKESLQCAKVFTRLGVPQLDILLAITASRHNKAFSWMPVAGFHISSMTYIGANTHKHTHTHTHTHIIIIVIMQVTAPYQAKIHSEMSYQHFICSFGVPPQTKTKRLKAIAQKVIEGRQVCLKRNV